MSTSPTFNTVTARTINLANPGSMSAAGTVIARDITATGNIVANNGAARRASFSQVTATGNVTGANFITLGVVNAVTQIRSSQIIANNSITVVGTTLLNNTGMITTGLISASGNVTGANMITAGRVSATGNVSGNYILGNGYFLTGLAGGGGTYGNSDVAQYLPTYTGTLAGGALVVGASTLINNDLSIQNNILAAGTITGSGLRGVTLSLTGNVLSALNVSANVAAINLSTTGRVSATGNVQGGNVLAIGTVSAIGNITGNYIFGNGAFLTGIANGGGGGGSSTYGNANVAAYLPTYTGALTAGSLAVGSSTLTANSLSVPLDVVAGRNINGANLIGTIRTASQTGITQVGTLGTLSVAGQIQAGSMALSGAATVGGALSATGTISAPAYAGNGYSLTNLLRSNQTRTVYVQTTAPNTAVTGDIWYQTSV